jgi:PAS domain S-box-containing protein
LRAAYEAENRTAFLRQAVREIRQFTECEAVGVRLLDEQGNIPYEAYEGFSKAFYDAESPLRLDVDQCMCISVIRGQFNPALPFFTKGGSFFMNGTTRFLATVSEEEKGATRNACNAQGYESVALAPVRHKGAVIGLIHAADRREGMVSESKVRTLETASLIMGTAILRVQAEEALRVSEEKYRALYDNAPLSYQSLDADGRILDVNPAWLRTLGYERDEVIGRSFGEFLHPDWKPHFETNFPELKRSGYKHDVQHRMRHKDGHYLDVSFEARVGRHSDGSFRQTYCVFQDITDKKIAAQSLVASEKRFKMIVNSSTDGILIADLRSKKFVMCNPMIAAMLGYSQDELSHLGVPDVHGPEDLPAALQALGSLARGDRNFVESIPMARKDGTVFYADISCSRIELDGKEYVAAFYRDVTERIRAQAMARQCAADLAHASRLSTLGEMASGLAHEINQPLCAIVNYANSCKRMFATPAADLSMMSEVLEEIAAQADRAAKIVSHMRALVQKQPQRRSPAHVGALIKAVLELSGAEARSLGVDVILEIDKPVGCVYVDAILIQQVILNLVRNAFEAMRGARDGRKQLTIRGRRGCGRTVEITISDTGEGIDEKDFDRVFDSFFTTKPDGLGIGLSISKSIIASYGGSIWVTRNPDRGVTFHFTLPLKKDTDDS